MDQRARISAMLDRAIARQAGEWQQSCELTFNQYVSVEAFVGGQVKAVRVINHSPGLTSAQIKKEVQRVWFGVFTYATCGITWSEGNNWNIEAVVEYEDGKRSSILMDGWIHVEVQDREGRYWYLREWSK